jgi:type IV pilus assembly protein PilV
MKIARPEKETGSNAGFSLIEVLIGLSILAIGLLAVAALQISANLSSRSSADITQASALASGQMEEIMNLPFLHGTLDPASNPHAKSSGKYLIQWQVTNTDLNSDGVLESKTVDLTVSWKKILTPGPDDRQVKIVFIKHDG